MVGEKDFNQIKTELVNEIKGLREDLTKFMIEQAIHREIIYGNPIKSQRGLSQRVDQIEDESRERKKHQGWVWIALLGSLAERISHYLFHWGK